MKVNDWKNLAEEGLMLILKPRQFWLKAEKKELSVSGYIQSAFYLSFFVVFFVVVFNEIFFNSEYGILWKDTLIHALRITISLLVIYHSSVLFMTKIPAAFHLDMEPDTAKMLIQYSMVVLIIVTIVTSLIPFLQVLYPLSAYSLVIVYFGINTLIKIPADQKVSFTIVTLTVLLLNALIVPWILSKLIAIFIY